MRPGAHQIFHGAEFEIELLINSRRLRDGEHSLPKPPGTYRILALGDSFTFGWGVQARDTWWARLGRLMAHRMSPVPVEMINLGVYFYTFDQQVQRLQELGLAYHPDMIVVGFYYPHVVTMATHTYEWQHSKPWPRILDSTIYVDAEGLLRSGRPVPFEDLRRHSALADFALSRYKRIRYSFSPAGRLHKFGLLEEDQEGRFRHLWDLTRGAYATLMQVALNTRSRGRPRDSSRLPGVAQLEEAFRIATGCRPAFHTATAEIRQDLQRAEDDVPRPAPAFR